MGWWRRLSGSAPVPAALLCLLVLSGCQPAVSPEAEAFANRYALLHREKDIEGLAGLVAWGDAPPATRPQFMRAMAEETRWPIESIRITEAGPTDIRAHFGDESPPAGPLFKLEVRLETDDGFGSTWLVGKPKEGQGLHLLLQPGA